mgnify:CR=1 FL=1
MIVRSAPVSGDLWQPNFEINFTVLSKENHNDEFWLGKKSEFLLEVTAGKMELNYTNSMLKTGIETMIEFKKL